DGRNVDGRRGHDLRRRGLVATGGENDAVDGIAVKHLDQTQILQVAIKRCCRALQSLLNGVDGKLEGDATRLTDALANALGKLQMVPVARCDVRTALGDADDRLA